MILIIIKLVATLSIIISNYLINLSYPYDD